MHTPSADTLDSPIYFKLALNVAHENFQGELVVVNLATGKYYAMRREAADIFALCLQHASADEVVNWLVCSYRGESDRIASDARWFLAKLHDEGILSQSDSRPSSTPPSLASRGGIPFTKPEFEVHNDMQDLLMLDPIHEVDTAGWPVMKPQQD
jgi:hypothetical protein